MSATRPGSPEPRRLGDSLRAVSRELGLPDPAAFDAVIEAWPGAVGAAVSAHARPRHLRDGVVTVEVDDGTWATQLRYLETEIVTRLAGAGAVVTGLRVVVARPG